MHQPTGSADRQKTLAAPATRQLARQEDIDLDAVPTDDERDGTPFVTPAQVRNFANNGDNKPSAGQEVSAETSQPGGANTEKRVAYKGIRKVIGENMEEAKYNAPHVAHHDSTEIEDLVATRETFKKEIDEDVSITYLPFVIKAVIKALKAHPYMNSTLDKEAGEIRLKQYYDIGIATATDRGLVVPVIEDADDKGILELAREIDNLTTRARNGDLTPDEMRGSTFTITNFGAIGGDYATPIINYPEAAILGLGAIKERPLAKDGDVVACHTLPLSLSVDHRLIDGAVAAQFTNEVKTYLHTPEMLLL
jgi:pyruvate dehydrogenase E2 component (dihydrolipoamide acetyltransferase)